ncbi:MAG: porin [Rhizobiaceae bacterium]|nr:porin [Rhizobiaceae bacterium]
MTFKSILLGAAAALVATTGARAADAVVVIPEPEPVEYVRVCDTYGAGYFYIPGTETCLRLSGYYRYDIFYWPGSAADPVAGTPATEEGYYKHARFAPSFTAKSETEWGTLTGHATVFINWDGQPPAVGYGTSVDLDHMYIELAGIRLGKGDTPYARFLGYGAPVNWYDGYYGFNNSAELSYTYSGSNGFSFIVAAVEDQDDTDWAPNGEVGFNYAQGWGSAGAIFGYDENGESWGGKFVVRITPADLPVSGSLHVFYSGTGGAAGDYTILDPAGARTEWSILAGASVALGERTTVNAGFQWFDTNEYYASANVAFNVAGGLYVTPEIAYTSPAGGDVMGLVRFQLDY